MTSFPCHPSRVCFATWFRKAPLRAHANARTFVDMPGTTLTTRPIPNSLYGAATRFSGEPSEAQSLAVRRIVAACSKDRHDFCPQPFEESARQILGARFDYGCLQRGLHGGAFRRPAAGSPNAGGRPVTLNSVLEDAARDVLNNFEHRLLETPEVVAESFSDGSLPTAPFFDKIMRTDCFAYLRFLSMCAALGLLRAVRRRRAGCPLFVSRKKEVPNDWCLTVDWSTRSFAIHRSPCRSGGITRSGRGAGRQ